MRFLASVFAFLLSTAAFADVVSGRTMILFHDRWAPMPTGPVIPLGVPAKSAAYDGERFLVAWREGDVVWLALFDEGATVPFVRTSVDLPGAQLPMVRWDGTAYVLAVGGTPAHVCRVSRQGVVESIVPVTRVQEPIADAAASPSGVALLVQYPTATHTSVLDVVLLDSEFALRNRVTVGSIIKSTGSGITFISKAQIVPFGNVFYAAWYEGRPPRYQNIVGTRVLLDGTAPETTASTREASSLTATLLENENIEVATVLGFAIHPYGSRLAVQPIRWFGFGVTTTFVESDGKAAKTAYQQRTYGLPFNLTTVRLSDGSIVAAYIREDGVLATIPMLPPPPATPRRRSLRH